jgi:DNA-binding beta-propeller fold protein YncE
MNLAGDEKRSPCPKCGTPILVGARKCRGCRTWLAAPPSRPVRITRSLTMIVATVVAVLAVLVTRRESPVGEAPPLTDMSATATNAEPAPAALGPEANEPKVLVARAGHERRQWQSRHIMVDVHPLDVAFSADGATVYVSGDDATLRAFDVATGRAQHVKRMPAQGDRIRLLHDRYVAMIRHVEAAHIPVADTENWDAQPITLWVGAHPADIVAMPDGKTVVTASSRGKRLTWFDLSTMRRLGDIKLPHAPRQLYLLELPGGKPYIATMGMLRRGGRPAGAWLDLFDPSESPFGATRRSIAVGRDPRPGVVSSDRRSLFFADPASNTASMVRVDGMTETATAAVGGEPVASFLLHGDRYAITLNQGTRTATVLSVPSMKETGTLMFEGKPRAGATSPDGKTLFVSLGGAHWPPTGSGAVVVAGDPPQVVATFPTDRGAARIAAAPHGDRAAVANYFGKTLTIIEPRP